MSSKHELLSKIFEVVKDEKEIPYDVLYNAIDVEDSKINKARNKLILEYKLIEVINHRLSLTNEGEKYKDFDDYIKSLNKNTLTFYQKIYLLFFIFFGLFGVYKIVHPSVSQSEFDSLIEEFDSLKIEFDSLKYRNDSIILGMSKLKLELLNDTLQTKN